jgi:hypothetical protein
VRQVSNEFAKAAARVSGPSKITKEDHGWRVHAAFGFANREGDRGPVLRTIAVLVVPADIDDIPPGGLTQRLLQQLVAGITSDTAADAQVRQQQETFEVDGRRMTDEEVRRLRNEVRRLARRTGKTRGFGADFYATVAQDAIDVAGKGRLNVNEALATKYRKADPRPRNKRTHPVTIESTTVRSWISTARNRYAFLPTTGGRGRRVYAPTAALATHFGNILGTGVFAAAPSSLHGTGAVDKKETR